MSQQDSQRWLPTDRLIYGVLVKSFLPLQRYPELVYENSNYANVYVGAEVYVFEESVDKKWCRAYQCLRPFPEEFISNMNSANDVLPDVKPKVVIFPRKYVHFEAEKAVSTMPFFKAPSAEDFKPLISKECESRSFCDSLYVSSTDDISTGKPRKTPRPPFPFFRYQKRSFKDEMGPILSLISSHVYSMYSIGEFSIYRKMIKLYYDLDTIRFRLSMNLTTEAEKINLIRAATSLRTKIAKFLSSTYRKNKLIANSTPRNPDPYGFEGIFARDIDTGELLSYEIDKLRTLVSSSMLCGLTNNFPTVPVVESDDQSSSNGLFGTVRSSILVNLKDLAWDPSISDPKYQDLSICVYLRTKDEVLTESFTMTKSSNMESALDEIPAMLFKNILETIVHKNKVYLVVVLKETIAITTETAPEISSYNISTEESSSHSPFSPFNSSTENKIDHVKKGLAAGVIDISPVFKFYNGPSVVNKAQRFNLYLYSSDSSDSQNFNSSKDADLGWGGLINKIIKDSSEGVSVNPRAVSLSVTVKEIIGKQEAEKVLSTSLVPIRSIPTYFYDTMFSQAERIYLNLGRVSLYGLPAADTNIENVTVQISCRNKAVKFCKNKLEERSGDWKFVSVRPNESIGESIRIEGVENMNEDETLRVLVYLNGFLMAKSNIHIKKKNEIIEYRKGTVFQIMSSKSVPLIHLELEASYFGRRYNIHPAITNFLVLQTKNVEFDQQLKEHYSVTLKQLNNVSFKDLLKHFDTILAHYLLLLESVNEATDKKGLSSSLPNIVFSEFVKFLNLMLTHQENSRYWFNRLYKKVMSKELECPNVAPILIKHMTMIFDRSHSSWTRTGTAVCRTILYIIVLAIGSSHSDEMPNFSHFFRSLHKFLMLADEPIMADQILLIESIPSMLETMTNHCKVEDLVRFAIGLFECCQEKEMNQKMYSRTLSVREEEYLNAKFNCLLKLINKKVLQNYLTNTESVDKLRLQFLSKTLEWLLTPYTPGDDKCFHVESLRLVNSVFITIIEDYKFDMLQRNLIRLLPYLCKSFVHLRRYCKKARLMRPRRVFTMLFPREIPCNYIPVDSIVNDEVVVEVLLELAIIICEITKIASSRFPSYQSFSEIINLCDKDTLFQSNFYSRQITNENVYTITKTVFLFFKQDWFPGMKWLGVSALLGRSSLILLSLCKDYIIENNSPSPSKESEKRVDMRLWAEYVKVILLVSNHKSASLTKLAITPRKAVYLISGDLKKISAYILNECWDALATGHYNITYAKKYGLGALSDCQFELFVHNQFLIREIFIFAFHRHIDATRICCKILWGLGLNFWRIFGSLQPAVNACIPELFSAYQIGKLRLNDYELERFVSCLFFMMHVPDSDTFFPACMDFLRDLLGFLHIVNEIYKIPNQEEFDDDRTARHIEMFEYLLEANRPELFHKMIYDLFIHFIQKKDFVQAALSLELLAGTYAWDSNDTLEAISFPPLPEQSSFERKEYLLKESARNFSRGQKPEKALAVYKDLIKAYDEINYDLNGLAFVHDQIAGIYTRLQSIDRLVPTYFKVSFMGFGFPKSLRNKSFVFEGLPFEHITSMHDRLLRSYHGSNIVHSQEEVDMLLMNPPMGKYIHVASVEPCLSISDNYNSSDKKSSINNKVRMYIENRDLRTFSNSRRLPGAKGVTDLWVEEYTYHTMNTFPTLMNRSEIVKVTKSKLSPLENAIRSLQVKIQELYGLENMCNKTLKDHGDVNDLFTELSTNITGTISAPVNGGISQYKAFLEPSTSKQFSTDDLGRLTLAFDELVAVLGRCLTLHAELLPSKDLKPSHDLLVRLFEENFAEEIERYSRTLSEANRSRNNMITARIISHKNPNKKASFSGRDHHTSGSNHSQFVLEHSDSFGPNSLLFGKYLTRTLSHSSTTSSLDKSGIVSGTSSTFLAGSQPNTNTDSQHKHDYSHSG
ncbi:hypothetical protein H833_YJM1573L05252 [Saccharomyces cerevisiae YJM1573]|uniref:Conserved protein n=1 Tax=Saccharomyces cerevisiae (strain YJM789) TaxID=307796 RepID=A7A1U3_YEAS7|nr:hypothetical protein H781_YJM1133L05252 [Saccharomyces cerevisiae YJM1133]AJV48260.1 hypothetical protein H783_YJM1199L05251 [Saccharomyces cerevisiae YJM1199]AJV48716.1 hypothetical protein H784_YJM1202L05252 [Saccharomyces cerevisiae YJM1202]AJV51838.1 hypothetical protein H791_YJM1273L05252 [Saccharomyces cerevisiae YJM1273]AJV54977.1 hypothetical protein H798_YJM1338L05250 [Saccharomyces cerevisiae YJM1338]AJV60811.1 hypothetical protein H811_YJM1400L05252 [Saccharomyces cerevisiae YJM1